MTARTRVVATAVAAGLTVAAACGGCSGSGASVSTPSATPSGSTSGAAGSAPASASTAPPASASPSSSPTSSRPATLQEALAVVSPAVVRIDVTTCLSDGSGTGFLVAPGVVATAAHVVDGAGAGRITRGTKTSQFQILGIDRTRDVALVRAIAPVGGSTVELETAKPAVGQPVGTVGYSLGGNVSFHAGVINGLDRKVEIEGRTASGLIEHSAEALPGDSGAPLINVRGRVVGIHDAGIPNVAGQRLAVSAATAAPLIARWQSDPTGEDFLPVCDRLYDLLGNDIDDSGFQASAPSAWHSVKIYLEAMNRGDWDTAAAQFFQPPSPASLRRTSENSTISNAVLRNVKLESGKPVLWVEFTSRQPAGDGPKERPAETCTTWSLDYLFTKRAGNWLISRTRGHVGTTSKPCAGGD